jgi:hypothetical protein
MDSSQTFCKQITPDEYSSQQSEYTKAQLKLLESQMLEKSQTKITNYDELSESDYDDDVDVDVDVNKTGNNSNVNLTLNLDKFLNKSKPKAKKNTTIDTNLIESLLAQHDKDLQIISKLKNLNMKLENINHYMKLDLCSSQVTVNDLTDKLKISEQKYLEQTKIIKSYKYQTTKFSIYSGIIILLYIIIYIYHI